MKESSPQPKAEKCGVCFFVNNKVIFTLVKTKNEKFNNELLENTYFPKK
jgi:hypothetical protein